MLQKLVEITSEHPELLSSLVKAKQVPSYTILEREGRFYLSFFDSNVLLSTEKAEQSADVLLSNINAILKLPPFRVSCALKRTGEVITVDDNGREVTKKERSIPTSAAPINKNCQ